MVHSHILSLDVEDIISIKYKSPATWFRDSNAALETITKMTLDIADSHESFPRRTSRFQPLNCAYMMRAALRYVQQHDVEPGHLVWQQTAELRLRRASTPLDRC
jgi:hypothetical protein